MARVWLHYGYTMASVWHLLGKGLGKAWEGRGRLRGWARNEWDEGQKPVLSVELVEESVWPKKGISEKFSWVLWRRFGFCCNFAGSWSRKTEWKTNELSRREGRAKWHDTPRDNRLEPPYSEAFFILLLYRVWKARLFFLPMRISST